MVTVSMIKLTCNSLSTALAQAERILCFTNGTLCQSPSATSLDFFEVDSIEECCLDDRGFFVRADGPDNTNCDVCQGVYACTCIYVCMVIYFEIYITSVLFPMLTIAMDFVMLSILASSDTVAILYINCTLYLNIVLCQNALSVCFSVLGFIGPRELTLPESGERTSVTIGVIKGEFPSVFSYTLSATPVDGTASKTISLTVFNNTYYTFLSIFC